MGNLLFTQFVIPTVHLIVYSHPATPATQTSSYSDLQLFILSARVSQCSTAQCKPEYQNEPVSSRINIGSGYVCSIDREFYARFQHFQQTAVSERKMKAELGTYHDVRTICTGYALLITRNTSFRVAKMIENFDTDI